MERQKGRVLWLKKRKGEKDEIVFWAGYPDGNLYIYEFKERLPASVLDDILQKHNRECWIYDLNDPKVIYSAGEWKLLQANP